MKYTEDMSFEEASQAFLAEMKAGLATLHEHFDGETTLLGKLFPSEQLLQRLHSLIGELVIVKAFKSFTLPQTGQTISILSSISIKSGISSIF